MVKPILGILLLLCCLGFPARAVPPSDSSGTSAAAQDDTGAVWALPLDNSDGRLGRWQAGVRTGQTIAGAAGLRARALTRGRDGSVYALWQTSEWGSDQNCLVTVHRGVNSRILARFPGSVVRDFGFPSAPLLCAGAGGDVWIAGGQPMLWHISPSGDVKAFPLKPEQFVEGKPLDDFHVLRLSSLVDGAGRRWFWQKTERNWPPGGLRGVLIWDGTTLDYRPTLPGVPDRAFSLVAPLDPDHFWLALGADFWHRTPTDARLYQVNTRTLFAVPETSLPGGPRTMVEQVFGAGGDWYAVTQDPFGVGTTMLWRLRAGQWRKCLDSLEEIGGYYSPDTRHPWLAEPSGVWLGVSGGAWWLPRDDKPPVWVNWRRGLAALNISGLFPLANGSILAFGGATGTAPMAATPQPIRPLPPGIVVGGMGAPKYLGSLVADLRRHLWGTRFSYGGPCPLDEWDGSRWQTHLPPASIPGVNGLYACDTLGRLWLTTYNWHPPAQPQPVYGRAVYDPARDTWTKYDTVPDALAAADALPGMAFLAHHEAYGSPVFSGDGRVTYFNDATLFLYDGRAWHHWQARDIQPSDTYSNLSPQPRFNSDSHLETALDDRLWEWTPAEGWQRTGARETAQYENPVPPGGPRGLTWATPTVDSFGAKWFTWHHAVYRAWQGRWAKLSELSAFGSPFQDGRGVEDVLRDPVGRFFFVTRPAGYYDLVVWSPPPTPGVTLSVVPTAEDSVAVRVRAKPPGAGRFLWRLNGGDWKSAQTADTIRLTALPHGDYRVEAEALDPNLQTSAPSVAVFSIRVTPQTQIARWVRALLSGTEDAREAAVAGLLKQPDAALPALRAARPGASEAGRWWLDAAIQQITGRGGEDKGN